MVICVFFTSGLSVIRVETCIVHSSFDFRNVLRIGQFYIFFVGSSFHAETSWHRRQFQTPTTSKQTRSASSRLQRHTSSSEQDTFDCYETDTYKRDDGDNRDDDDTSSQRQRVRSSMANCWTTVQRHQFWRLKRLLRRRCERC